MGLLDREARFYLANRKALIFDDKRASRQEIKNALINSGVRPENIFVEKSFANAKHVLKTVLPEIIISEFEVYDNFGLDLARLQMDLLKGEYSNKIFIIATANATQTSVADAAEEEVEAFLVKPIKEPLVTDYLVNAVKKKINPSAYASMVYEAKRLIRDGQLEMATQTLNMSKLMHERPMMACYLMGEVFRQQGKLGAAMIQFEEGLEYNKIHFKCLVGKFLTLIDQKQKQQAFATLETICEHFPLTPELLKKAFILSITSYHFEEVQTYYEQYLRQPRKTPELKLTVSQALQTAGKILLRERKHIEKALDFFKKGAIISGRKREYLSEILETLIKEGFPHETDKFFSLFDSGEINSVMLKQFRFRAFAKTMHKHQDAIVQRGKELIYANEADEECFLLVCDLLKKLKRPKLLETIVYKGVENLPGSKKKLLKYIDAA